MEKLDFTKKYVSKFEKAGYKNGIGSIQLFYDFVSYNTSKLRAIGECHEKSLKEYKALEEKYSDETMALFSEAMNDLIIVLSDKIDDYLGKLYTRLGANKRSLGQYYTPFNVSSAIANINLTDVDINKENEEAFTISDPCCGSGSLLLASVDVLKKRGVNYALDTVMYAQDLDPLAASMCYLQLSAVGAAASINIGNTLTMEVYDTLPTLALIGQMQIRRLRQLLAS